MTERGSAVGADRGGPDRAAGAPTHRLYSADAVGIATFLGTPVAGAWLMALNERRLGRGSITAAFLLAGALGGTLVLGVLGAALPRGFAFPVALVALWATRAIAASRHDREVAAHVAAGGPRGSSWRAAAIGLGTLAVLFVTFGIGATVLLVVAPTSVTDPLTHKVSFPPLAAVEYQDDATEEQAREVGAVLVKQGLFGQGPADARVSREGKRGTLCVVSLVVKAGVSDREDVGAFERLARLMRDGVLGCKQVELVLCDDAWAPRRSFKAE